MKRPRFKKTDQVLLISVHRGRRTITPVTIVEQISTSKTAYAYRVQSGLGGDMIVLESDLRPNNMLDRLLLEIQR